MLILLEQADARERIEAVALRIGARPTRYCQSDWGDARAQLGLSESGRRQCGRPACVAGHALTIVDGDTLARARAAVRQIMDPPIATNGTATPEGAHSRGLRARQRLTSIVGNWMGLDEEEREALFAAQWPGPWMENGRGGTRAAANAREGLRSPSADEAVRVLRTRARGETKLAHAPHAPPGKDTPWTEGP